MSQEACTPHACRAITSESADQRDTVSTAENNKAMGSVSTTTCGREYAKSRRTSAVDASRETSSSAKVKRNLITSKKVVTEAARKNGPSASRTTARPTIQGNRRIQPRSVAHGGRVWLPTCFHRVFHRAGVFHKPKRASEGPIRDIMLNQVCRSRMSGTPKAVNLSWSSSPKPQLSAILGAVLFLRRCRFCRFPLLGFFSAGVYRLPRR
ncbi:hypothetical protein HRbin09_01489 [bacterium HR09]|nr:hypothetical protein HRbin09_01489 [bacterium HR09]